MSAGVSGMGTVGPSGDGGTNGWMVGGVSLSVHGVAVELATGAAGTVVTGGDVGGDVTELGRGVVKLSGSGCEGGGVVKLSGSGCEGGGL